MTDVDMTDVDMKGVDPKGRMFSWPFSGNGLGGVGVGGQPVSEAVPTPGPAELLVRVDAVTLCASDGKMLRLGTDYPLLRGRDLQAQPTRLGHEVALTVVAVGQQRRGQYRVGQRLGLQPDVFVGGERRCFGVTLPGGLTQYLVLGSDVLEGDDGPYIFSVGGLDPDGRLSLADVAVTEPWACVEMAYQPKRRLQPLAGGRLWIHGDSAATGFVLPPFPGSEMTLSGSAQDYAEALSAQGHRIQRNELADILNGSQTFDDILLLDPADDLPERALPLLSRGGLLNLSVSADNTRRYETQVDASRLHYEPISLVGQAGPEVGAAYGEHRSDLRPGGSLLIHGAGGAMGRMHLERALSLPHPPGTIVATNRGAARLSELNLSFAAWAAARGVRLKLISPVQHPGFLEEEARRLGGFDDVVVNIPSLSEMQYAANFLRQDGLLALFAGIPEGQRLRLPLGNVAHFRAEFTGTSGSSLADQRRVIQKTLSGELDASSVIAAVCGLRAAREGLAAVMDGRYTGKIVVYPPLLDLPLLGLEELATVAPGVYAGLNAGRWTKAAEDALFAQFAQPVPTEAQP
ncbi:alcohol dehydrogenase catalytic domain-containing protein [Deinococcus marmoris]|uniref:Oxidoreductase linked to yggC n=1 Tax=Deinococcus marmoris TaxID=249408 RepID=A0A1U7NU26_9DEIO|nr:alcohol dehydrogenase catalytic domain-containing protein [Deinococcus marmoris]OLV16422.1 oxidoreductase linked to yggC [Deinococcus marmoris]